MPILNDILEHEVLGREFRKGWREGLRKGRWLEALAILRRVIEARFGRIPPWAEEHLTNRPLAELEDLAVRLLNTQSLEELLNQTP